MWGISFFSTHSYFRKLLHLISEANFFSLESDLIKSNTIYWTFLFTMVLPSPIKQLTNPPMPFKCLTSTLHRSDFSVISCLRIVFMTREGFLAHQCHEDHCVMQPGMIYMGVLFSIWQLPTFAMLPRKGPPTRTFQGCSAHSLPLQPSSSLPFLQSSSPSHRKELGMHCPFPHSIRPWLWQARKSTNDFHVIY